jgi:hypothetical protein
MQGQTEGLELKKETPVLPEYWFGLARGQEPWEGEKLLEMGTIAPGEQWSISGKESRLETFCQPEQGFEPQPSQRVQAPGRSAIEPQN